MNENQNISPDYDPKTAISTEEREFHWYENVYQGETKQLTLRAILMGSVLGGVMALSNLYVGLKTGWGLGVAITACILAYATQKVLSKILPFAFGKPLTILENNCSQSTASSAGYSTGGTLSSAMAAYLMVSGHHLPWMVLGLWTFFLAALGVFMAIPMKRQMINIEQLKFPSGIAAAETLKSLHAEGLAAMIQARSLGFSGLIAGLVTWFRDAGKPFSIPSSIPFPGTLMGKPMGVWTFEVEVGLVMIAAGAIMGWKIAWSMLLGGAINFGFLAPWAVEVGAIPVEKIGYRGIVSWSTWAGSAMLVTSGLLSLIFHWRTIGRALGGFLSVFFPEVHENQSETQKKLAAYVKKIEVPSAWFLIGTLLSGAGCVWMLVEYFGTVWWMGVLSVLLTFILGLVACRATGETDITPIGAMGKITQLLFGWLAPSQITTNLMTASVTAGAASSSADLLTDLKSGYLLGANPRQQFWAQFLGIFAGTLVVVPAFYILVPDASVLGGSMWPAPSAQVWAAVAKLLSQGLSSLHSTAQGGMVVGALIGLAIPLLEKISSERVRSFIPSATGLGLSLVIPFSSSLGMFIGAVIALILEKKAPKIAETYIIPVSSGLIAGESIVGVVISILSTTHVI